MGVFVRFKLAAIKPLGSVLAIPGRDSWSWLRSQKGHRHLSTSGHCTWVDLSCQISRNLRPKDASKLGDDDAMEAMKYISLKMAALNKQAGTTVNAEIAIEDDDKTHVAVQEHTYKTGRDATNSMPLP